MHHDRVFLAFAEIGREDHEAIQFYAILRLEGEQSTFTYVFGGERLLQFLVIDEDLELLSIVVAKASDRRGIEIAVGVHEIAASCAEDCVVGALLT